jgi:hypothetical protein
MYIFTPFCYFSFVWIQQFSDTVFCYFQANLFEKEKPLKMYNKFRIKVVIFIILHQCYIGPCHHGMAHPWVVDGGDSLQI